MVQSSGKSGWWTKRVFASWYDHADSVQNVLVSSLASKV